MLKLGLTGGMGAGKSTVARLFASLGCPTLDLDEVSRQVTAPSQPALQALLSEFGASILQPDGRLDRSALAKVIFADPAARARAEGILHPAIRRAADDWVECHARKAVPPLAVMLEIPLLFESGLEATVDRIILVTAPVDVRVARIMARGLTEEQARARIAAQLPEAIKLERSHYVIPNAGTPDALIPQVEAVWRALTEHR